MKFVSEDGLAYFWGKVKNYIDSKAAQDAGVYVGSSAPNNTSLLWVDTGSGGVLKYHNGTAWVATKAVWG